MNSFSHTEFKIPCLLSGIIFSMILLPLLPNLMHWVIVLAVCAIVVCVMRARRPIPELKNMTINLFALFCLALLTPVFLESGLLTTMMNLLVVACSLKFLMMRNQNDFHLVAVVFIFLVAKGFINNQSLFFALYYMLVVFLIFFLAYQLHKGALSLSTSVKNTAILLIQTTPIAILIFLVAPRLPPFWQIPKPSTTQTGLSEHVTPGDISNLAQSSNLVFRAEFTGAVPDYQQRYWRALVMDYFDGTTWSISEIPRLNYSLSLPEPSSAEWEYLINAEPTGKRWLYSLDIPEVVQSFNDLPIYVSNDYRLIKGRISDSRNLYIVRSHYQVPLNLEGQDFNRERYLQLPNSGNPKTREWIANQDFTGLSVNQIIGHIGRKFITEPFSYTLKPPLMQEHPVDQFLFEYQKGFCSHYASAMAYMLRLAGVPSRIVTGYQGGETQTENIVTVRQYDAHAWIEAWDPQVGWIRFDPTGLVAPNRLMSGLFSALHENEHALIDDNRIIRALSEFETFAAFENMLVLINHNWSQFVLGYDQNSQLSIVERLFGKANVKNLVTFLVVAFIGIAVYLFTSFVPWRKWFFSKPVAAELILIDFLTKKGWQKHTHETLQQYIQRIGEHLPISAAQALHTFCDRFYQHKYAEKLDTDTLDDSLKDCIKQFNVAMNEAKSGNTK